jgi:TonB family protein
MSAAKNSVWRGVLLAAVALSPVASMAQADAAPSKRDVIYRIAPTYPELARRCNLHGDVRLSVVVAPDGKVTSATVSGGNPVLAQAAMQSVRTWKFAPEPRTTTEQIELRFGPK